ncbi:MAG: endolytic transglycosylase MltG [Rhodanobacteraceae bacterium]
MKRMAGGAMARVLLGLVLFALLAAAGIAWSDYSRFLHAPLSVKRDGSSLLIKSGSSFRQIVDQLEQRKLSGAPFLYWRFLATRMGVTESLHAGEYALPQGIEPGALLHMLAAGKVLQHKFTIVDGWTFAQVRHALDTDPLLVHATRELDNATIMQRIGAGGQDPEGRFLPETYAFTRGTRDLDLLARAHGDMDKVLAHAWQQRADGLPLDSPYQALILASIVEKETARADERARIAGVFVRRLQRGMALATDPTVIYGMGSRYDGNITRRDLKTDTPYNTYLRAGLPPTPIAMPGKAAIEAALHPAAGKSLYFVARGDGTGRHVFSATLAAHNRAVACYQLKRCRQ